MSGAGTAPRSEVRPLFRGRVIVLVGIVLSALSLRAAVTAATPVLDRISGDLHFGNTTEGFFGTLPTLFFAAAGLVTPPLVRRFGLERIAFIAAFLTGLGALTRAFSPNTASLLLLSAVAVAGMGMGNVVLPPLVKRYFSDRVSQMSMLYVTVLQAGTVLPALTAVPVANATNWRVSIALWSLAGLVASVPWLIQALRGVEHRDTQTTQELHAHKPIWRSTVAWSLALMFGLTSLVTYAMFTWIPRILTEAGASDAFAGDMVGLFAALGIFPSLLVPVVAARLRNVFPIVAFSAVCNFIGILTLALTPLSAPIVWVAILGLGASTFPLSLLLINLRTQTGAGAARLSGFSHLFGYTIACTGPVVFGVLRNATGGFGIGFVFLAVVTLLMLLIGIVASRPIYLEDQLAG